MSRKRAIAIAGLAILALLALVERATQRSEIIAGRVSDVITEIPQRGPDLWIVTVTLQDGNEIKLEPTPIRPAATIGTQLCIRQQLRSWAPPKYQIAPESGC